jgi:hypothetical protein
MHDPHDAHLPKAHELEEVPPTELDLDDPDVHGRIIDAFNTARRPKDLVELLETEGFDEQCCTEILEKRRALGWRGFTNLAELKEIRRIPNDFLLELWPLFGPARFGRWDMVGETTLNGSAYHVAHATLLRNGKVLLLPEANRYETLLWDPETGGLAATPNQPTDYLFCTGHTFLSDGRLLCVGGGGGGPSGVDRAWLYDPGTNQWRRTLGNMTSARWYPTALTLGRTRKVLVVSGAESNDTTDVYDEYTETFVRMTGPRSTRSFPQIYPGLHLLPGGEVFYSRTGFGSAGQGPGGGDPSATNAILRFSAPNTGEWTELASQMEHKDRVRGMSVLVLNGCKPTVRVLVVGGTALPGSGTAEMIGLGTLTPQWSHPATIPGSDSRINVSAVLLPDNTVFVVGGTTDPAVACTHFNPATNHWRSMARTNYRKQYHSVSVLLPNGKVLATGGSNYGGGSNVLEVFSPPYLFNRWGLPAARPTITTAPDSVVADDAAGFRLESPNAAAIKKVVFVRPMAVTHQTDTEQRVIECTFHVHGTTIHAHLPHAHDEPGLIPLGYYMVFIINTKGVPSVARFVRVS